MDGVATPVEARHRALLEALPDLLLRLGADGTYLELGGDLSRLANPPELVVGANVHDLLPADVAESLMEGVAAALSSDELATVNYRLQTHLGDLRDFELRIAPAAPGEVLAIVRDVTDLHDAIREVRESRARIVAAGDAERRRIERNLHDGAQQRLVAVSLHLHLIRQRLEGRPEAVPELLDAAQSELALALEEIRELVRGLHPRILTDHGLARAIRMLAERSLLPIEIAALPEERLGPSVEAAAYYVIAEALANAAKHAQAGLITVGVEALATHTVVEVADDGVGGADPSGTGLQGLADRVAALGGSFAVSSVPGAGTAVRAELPA
ncbi:MAG: sensor histidine kinase [Gaiellaceae bacterium MAG52_C11]|nr:sensor histidine kinase [Candidatus Gaiellasilicea maunaloa]